MIVTLRSEKKKILRSQVDLAKFMIFFLSESLEMLNKLSKGIKIPDLSLKFKALYMQKMEGDEASIE